jgi:hypothetical protein
MVTPCAVISQVEKAVLPFCLMFSQCHIKLYSKFYFNFAGATQGVQGSVADNAEGASGGEVRASDDETQGREAGPYFPVCTCMCMFMCIC